MPPNKHNKFNISGKTPSSIHKKSHNAVCVIDFKTAVEKRKTDKAVQAIINRATSLAL